MAEKSVGLEMFYVITCDAGVREKIRVSAVQFENLQEALTEAGRAAEAYKKSATQHELSYNEDIGNRISVKRIIRSDGEVIVVRTVGMVYLY